MDSSQDLPKLGLRTRLDLTRFGSVAGRVLRVFALAFASAVFTCPQAQALDKIWTGAVSTVWGTNTNWTGNAPSAGDDAKFNGTFTNQPSLGTNASIGGIWMTGSIGQNVTISGIGIAQVSGNAGFGILIDNANAFTLTINAPLQVAGIESWTNSSGNLFTVGSGGVDLHNNALTITGSGDTTISGVASGGGAFTKAGTGTLTLSNTGNSFTGQFTAQAGTVKIDALSNLSSNGELGNNALAIILGSSGGVTGTLEYTGGTGSSNRTFTLATGGTGAFQIDTAAAVVTRSGIIGGSGGLSKTGPGTLALSAVNTFSGGTVVSAGTLLLGNATNTLSDTGTVNVNGGTLDISSNSDTVGSVTLMSGTIAGTTGILTGSSYSVQSGTVSAKLGGTGIVLTKSTSGTVTLSGASTYTGATTVSAGTLKANDTAGSATGTGAVSVSSGATLGGGNGTLFGGAINGNRVYAPGVVGLISGGVTINTGGHLAPGNSVGTLTVGTLTLSSGSVLDYEFNASANDFTQVTTAGGLTINGGGFNLYAEGTTNQWTTNGTYDVIGYSGTLNGSVNNLSVLNGLGTKRYTFASTGSLVTLTIADTNTGTTYSLAASAVAARILSGQTTSITSTITNTGTGTADSLNFTGLGATAVTGATTNGGPLAQGAAGNNAGLIYTGNTVGVNSITPTVSTATNASIGGSASLSGTTPTTVTVVNNRVVNASSVALGNVLVGATTGSQSSSLTTSGADTVATRVTVAGTGTGGGVSVVGSSTLFNSASSTGSRTVSASFGISGSKGGSVTLTTTGEGLTGEAPVNVALGYTATVYQPLSTSVAGATLTNASANDNGAGSLRANAAILSGATAGNNPEFGSVNGIASGTIIAPGGSVVASSSLSSTANLLNGIHQNQAVVNVGYDTAQSIQGAPAGTQSSPTLTMSQTVAGNSVANNTPQTAVVLAGQKYGNVTSGFNSMYTAGKGTTGTLLGGTAAAQRTSMMAWNNAQTAQGKAAYSTTSVGTAVFYSDVLSLSGTGASGIYSSTGTGPASLASIPTISGFGNQTQTGAGGDEFVLQMSYQAQATDAQESGFYIAWQGNGQTTHDWVNAVLGNDYSTGGAFRDAGLVSFANYLAFQSYNGSGTLTSGDLGAFGRDPATNVAWAVVNHEGAYSVVPESRTILAGLALLCLLTWRERKRARAMLALNF